MNVNQTVLPFVSRRARRVGGDDVDDVDDVDGVDNVDGFDGFALVEAPVERRDVRRLSLIHI